MIKVFSNLNVPAKKLNEIEKECFSAPWSEESFKNAESTRFYVFFEDERAVGYVGIYSVLDEGYIKKFEVIEDGVFKTIHITLKYGADKNDKIITGLKRISKPGLRIYAGKDELPKVLGGLGVAIISTNQGVVTDKQARKLNVGGEVLAYIW